MNVSARLIVSSAAALQDGSYFSAGPDGLFGRATGPEGEGQTTVEERLDRIERLLQELIDQGKAEDAHGDLFAETIPQGQPFRPDSIPKRDLRSTRLSPQAGALEFVIVRDAPASATATWMA